MKKFTIRTASVITIITVAMAAWIWASAQTVVGEGEIDVTEVYDIYREEKNTLIYLRDLNSEIESIIESFHTFKMGTIEEENNLRNCIGKLEELRTDVEMLRIKSQCLLNYEDISNIVAKMKERVCEGISDGTCMIEESKMLRVLGYIPTNEEIRMLECVVEAEVGGTSLDHKMLSTQTVINRIHSEEFEETDLKRILTAKGQYSTIGNYYNNYRKVTDTTKEAVYRAITGDYCDVSQGALYYYSPKYCKNQKTVSWFENNLTFLFEIDGVRYFK